MKVGIICVNYKSDEYLFRFLASIDVSYQHTDKVDFFFEVVVVDNDKESPNAHILRFISELSYKATYINSAINTGYFGGARLGVKMLTEKQGGYDFLMISNVDLVIEKDYLSTLIDFKCARRVGVIAPNIFSMHRRVGINPKILKRVPKYKYILFRIIVGNRYLFWINSFISDTFYRLGLRSALKVGGYGSSYIYAPHGAAIIFTKAYFEEGAGLDYPVFLFGEEIFVAESCLQRGLLVKYEEQLRINDTDHGSTSLIKSDILRNEYRKALDYVLREYY